MLLETEWEPRDGRNSRICKVHRNGIERAIARYHVKTKGAELPSCCSVDTERQQPRAEYIKTG